MIRIKYSFIQTAVLVHGGGALLVLGGLCFWGGKWLDSQPPEKPVTAQVLPAEDAAGKALAEWLGPGEVRLNAAVLGLARRSDRAVALLSINGAAPKPYLVGEFLMPGVSLQAIEAEGVVLEHAGRVLHLKAPVRPAPPAAGIAYAR